ncbi:MAG: ATP-dependent DNA helicase RecG [Sphaerochaetaceae bacterium]|nr:ATP-dependent DNA helicase RecG [Sphaerochaetaceae bacterium]
MLIAELENSISSLRGVGPAAQKDYAKMGISTFKDLLQLSPRSYDDRSVETTLRDVTEDNVQINSEIVILSHTYFGGIKKGQRTLKVICREKSGYNLSLLCFGRAFLERTLSVGSAWYINATVTRNRGEWQTSAFSVYRTMEEAGLGTILPIYPLSGNLNQRIIRRDIRNILSNRYLIFDDEMPSYLYEKYSLLHTNEAIRLLHFPKSMNDVERARRSLALSELLLMEISIKRESTPRIQKRARIALTPLEEKFLRNLPFSLTEDQVSCLEDIRSDLDSKGQMNRLLQGDVGCGKTLIAWLSALHVISKKGQVAFMAPTELLARQHAEKAAELFEPLGVNVAFITGDVKGKGRKLLLEALKKGDVDIAIGTHALFSKDIEFKNLRYVIIDEQHRFGVEQRQALSSKGINPHLLMMSATPIPRTLALTFFGDLTISTIHTMPGGRKPIITHLVTEHGREKMYQAVGVEFLRGHQAYFVYPKIDDEGESDLRDVTTMFEFLKGKYPGVPSALIHSKVPEEEKMSILERFRKKELMYLVSTSVVEVGIDIPEATCMIIEHSERFGLAALHQLRGRVGRSNLQSWCFLVFSSALTEDAKARLSVMRDTTDGFVIAEKDLEIRGPGEIAGEKQSGFLRLRYASLANDIELIEIAGAEAEAIISRDRGLISSENYMLRTLLQKEDKTSII